MDDSMNLYLVYNRDHYGNRVVVRLMDGGARKFCWNLTLEQAELVLKRLLEPQSKPHGQMHEKLSYPRGTLAEFLAAQQLLY